jgi:abequosyltransferase
MQPERPLLTIAIPTYNRSSYLARLLGGLMPQLIDEPQVELIISDNASPDDTQGVVQSFQQKGLQLVYIRNEINHGPDANFLQCFEKANGKYVWLIGDDDFILPAAIEKILRYLSKQEYDLVYVTPYGIQDPRKIHIPVNSSGISEVCTPEEFARRVHVFFTFISSNIVNKDRICSSSHRPFSDLIGTNLIQLGWVYTALNRHRRSLFIHERLVAGTIDNSGGYGIVTVFGLNLTRITNEWLESDRVKRPITNATLQRFFPYSLLATKRADGTFAQEDPDHLLRPLFGGNFRYWLFTFPVIMMPSPLADLWVFGGRCINWIDKMTGGLLLR